MDNKQKGITKNGWYFLAGVFILYGLVSLLMLLIPVVDFLTFITRWAALMGYVSLFIATLLANYVREVFKNLGKPFMKIHHYFAIVGILLVTAHPVAFAIQVSDITVFIPDVSSWYRFWLLAGRPALYVIYASVIAAILRKKINKYWRQIHALMYLALLFGLVHAIMIGTDFTNAEGVTMIILFNAMFTISFGIFLKKRLEKRKRKQSTKKK